MNRVAGYSCYEQGDYAKALTYMNNLFAQLPADRILKKDYIYYARIIMKNNEDYGKELGDLEKAKADLAKVQEKNESLKGAAKEKEKVSEEPLVAKIAEIQKSVDASEKALDKGYDAYEKAITFGEEDTYLIRKRLEIYTIRDATQKLQLIGND